MAWEKGPHNSSPLLQLLFMSVCLFLADAQLGGKARRANAFREPFANSIQAPPAPFDVNRKVLVPPGSGRVVILKADELTRYSVTLAATTAYENIDNAKNWPRQDFCGGAGLLAVAYREDELPRGIFPPLPFTIGMAQPSPDDRLSLALLEHGCNYTALLSAVRQKAAGKDALLLPQDPTELVSTGVVFHTDDNSTWASYWVSQQQIRSLIAVNNNSTQCSGSCTDSERMVSWGGPNLDNQTAFGDQDYLSSALFNQTQARFLQRYNMLPPAQRAEEQYDSWDNTTQQYYDEFSCSISDAELHSPLMNITLPPEQRVECWQEGARIFVFLYNCFVASNATNSTNSGSTDAPTDPTLLVSVSLDYVQETSDNTSCYTPADRAWKMFNVIALGIVMIAMGLTLLLFEVGPTLRRWLSNRLQRPQSSTTATYKGYFRPLQLWALCGRAAKTMNSPSGYSRLYTVAITASAALLIAAIVWQPSVRASAQHDHAWLDNPTSPVKDDPNISQHAQVVVYYLKVMAISALIGYTVKLALLANMGVPDSGSKGVVVKPHVWRTQVVFSIVGVLSLTLIAVSNVSYMLRQYAAWNFKMPYTYLMVCIGVHHLAALVLFVVNTFFRPPPLKSADYLPLQQHPLPANSKPQHKTSGHGGQQDTKTSDDKSEASQFVEPGLLARAASCFASIVCDIKGAFLEDQHFRYSSWILIPVWLSFCLMIFWYLMGVTRSDFMVHCVRDPQDCVGGQLKTWLGVANTLTDFDTVQSGMEALSGMDREVLMASINNIQEGLKQAVAQRQQFLSKGAQGLQDWNMLVLPYVANLQSLSNTLQGLSDMAQKLYKPWEVWGPRIEGWKNHAEASYYAGRWVGYTLATICALASLLVILRTFKRVLLHQHFHKLQPKQQELMLHTLEHSGGAESRAFGRAISFMRDGSIIDMGLSRRVNSLPGTLRGMYGPDAKVSVGHHQNKRLQREETWTDYDAQIDAQEAAPAADTVAVANSSREAAAKEQGGLQEVYTQRASTEIMYTIQMLEGDMATYGIGASVALFGVLVSTMWIQIRVVGFILTVIFTVLFHPVFWTEVMSRWWVTILSLIALVLFNMLVVKRFIGSMLLSDGTRIKHRGAWMTFYLMCQLAFLVVGVLYASWRVIWALIVMLLYGVACLDRSILLIFKFLDGSYIAFVSSVKLEAAWRSISQQQVDDGSAEMDDEIGSKDIEH